MSPTSGAATLTSMTARAVERLEERLGELRRTAWTRLATAVAAALLAAPAFGWDRGLGTGLVAGAFVMAVLSLRAFGDRTDLADAGAVDRDALTIPAIRRHAARIASPRELATAAETLRRLADESPRPRVLACRAELLALADALSRSRPPDAAIAVRCVRFVEGPGSPLFGTGAGEAELRSALRHLLLLLDETRDD
jgi:hypothetical protein